VLSGAFTFSPQVADGLPAGPAAPLPQAPEGAIVHDAEYYILEAQNGQVWAAEADQLTARLS